MQQPVYVYFSRISWAVVSSSTAAQLLAAAERVPFAGPGLKPLVLCIFTCQCRRHVKARGRLSERTLCRRNFFFGIVTCMGTVPVFRYCPRDHRESGLAERRYVCAEKSDLVELRISESLRVASRFE